MTSGSCPIFSYMPMPRLPFRPLGSPLPFGEVHLAVNSCLQPYVDHAFGHAILDPQVMEYLQLGDIACRDRVLYGIL